MDFAFSEEQEMLRRSARDFLAKECPPKVVRKLMEASDAYDPALWAKIAGLGWTALGIPEEYGGVGTFLDLVVVLEEAGRALLPGPFFATMGLAVPAIIEAGSEAQKKKALGAIASGGARATLAFTEPSARWDASGVTLKATPSGGGWKLDGVKLFVPDAASADYMVVAARTRGEGEDGITLLLIEGKPKGMSVNQLQTLDMTRRWSEVRFEGVEVRADALMGAPHKAWPALKRALEWATAALCAEMVGGAQKVLETSTDYAKTRHQFGKPCWCCQRAAGPRPTTPRGRSTPTHPIARSHRRWRRRTCPMPTARWRATASRCTAASGSRGSTTCTCTSSEPKPQR